MYDQYIVVSSDSYALIFVHAENSYLHRRSLWLDIRGLPISGICIIGDFNVVLGAHVRTSSATYPSLPVEEFQEFVDLMGLFDVEAIGNEFTWSTRYNLELVSARLDRALDNQIFLDQWNAVELLVLPRYCSDHHPLRLVTRSVEHNVHRPFCFHDMWFHHKIAWSELMHMPTPVLRFVQKLKRLKNSLRDWNRVVFRDVFVELEAATTALDEIQQLISTQRDSDALFDEEMHRTSIVNRLLVQRHAFLTQRGRLQW